MDRRSLLKTLTLSTAGYAVATPTLLQLLVSCTTEKKKEEGSLFLNATQAYVVAQLVDLILPATKTPGAIEVRIPEFLDLVLNEAVSKTVQEEFVMGASFFESKFKAMYQKDILKGTKQEFDTLLALYFKISTQKQNEIFSYLKKEERNSGDRKELYFIYQYLLFIRKHTLFGFYTSKKIGTEVLSYVPVPGKFEACISVEEAGNVSSL